MEQSCSSGRRSREGVEKEIRQAGGRRDRAGWRGGRTYGVGGQGVQDGWAGEQEGRATGEMKQVHSETKFPPACIKKRSGGFPLWPHPGLNLVFCPNWLNTCVANYT